MKYYFINALLILFLFSCTDAQLGESPLINSATINHWVKNTNFEALNIDLRPFLNEDEKTITLELERTEIVDKIWQEAKEKAAENWNNYDELNLVHVIPYGTNLTFEFEDYYPMIEEKLYSFQYVYIPDNGGDEFILGEHIMNDYSSSWIQDLKLIGDDFLNEFVENPGIIALRLVFNELPENQVRITNYEINFVYEFNSVRY